MLFAIERSIVTHAVRRDIDSSRHVPYMVIEREGGAILGRFKNLYCGNPRSASDSVY